MPKITYAPVTHPSTQDVNLWQEQERVIAKIMQGYNVFFTSSADSGKSTLPRKLVKRLRLAGKMVRIPAPAGRAALDIGGATTWSYAGWSPDSMKLSIEEL